MVASAPKFYEIARELVELTQECTFVAHNAAFDYRFIQSEFEALGYRYERKTLDTVKLARKYIPGLRSYSLGNLCNDIGIELNNRHRALGDAKATAILFSRIYKEHPNLIDIPLKGLHSNLKQKDIDALPQSTGVYYFYDDTNQLIYVGKSTNIHSRVISHLNNTTTKKALEMKNRIASVDYENCGSELIALLLESDEIKRNLPVFNRAQRRSLHSWGLYAHTNADGYLCYQIERITDKNKEATPLTLFSSKIQAQNQLFALTEEHSLCQKLNGLYTHDGACFQYGIHSCNGACIGEEVPEEYNKRAQQIHARYAFEHENMLIVDKGRTSGEKAIVLVKNGTYRGFGFIDEEVLNDPVEWLSAAIKSYPNNRDTQSILQSYLKRKKVEQIICF